MQVKIRWSKTKRIWIWVSVSLGIRGQCSWVVVLAEVPVADEVAFRAPMPLEVSGNRCVTSTSSVRMPSQGIA